MAQNALELYKRIKSDPDLNPLEADPRLAAWTKAAQQPSIVSEYQATRQPIEDRAFLFPLGTYADGSVHAAWPGIIEEPAQSWVNMVDRARSGVDDVEADARDAFNVAGSVGLGSLAATPLKPTNALAAMGGKSFRAYHGSPHDFDKFDINKIGIGEGHQSFGHGLYFAENPEVAMQYKNELSNVINVDNKPIFEKGRIIGSTGNKEIDDYLIANLGDVDQAIATAVKQKNDFALSDPAYGEYQNIIQTLQNLKDKVTVDKKGRMYEVNINADPNEFLNWDKELSDKDLERLSDNFGNYSNPHLEELSNLFKYTNPNSMTGEEAYAWIGHTLKNEAVPDGIHSIPAEKAPEIASELKNAGFPGIKYLDRDSRNRTNMLDQSTRNYVVFDDKIIDILRKYGILAPSAGSQVYNQLEPSNALEQ